MKILQSVHSEGFLCSIRRFDPGVDPDTETERVEFTADADIDADGANGQNGARPAYKVDNSGSEHLANGGMGIRNGRVVGVTTWYDDIVILDEDGDPKVFPGGVIASKTAYRFPNKSKRDPEAYVDSETVPYVVVNSAIINGTRGAVLGCKAIAINLRTNERVEGVVGDVGPRHKIGEVSIEMARRLGFNPSPRMGGTEKPIVKYIIFPGVPATVGGHTYALQRSNGTHILA